MSQSVSTGLAGQGQSDQDGQVENTQGQATCQNGLQPGSDAHVATAKATSESDMSNGFENRTMEYERYAQERIQSQVQCNVPEGPQAVHYNTTSGRAQAVGPSLEEIHQSMARQSSLAPRYNHENPPANVDRVQYVSQTSTQTVPVQTQPQFAPDYSVDQGQYSQIRSQFEVRSQIYPQGQFGERTGYITRDLAYRDQGDRLYSQPSSTAVFTGQGQYVTVQPQPSQSASPQPQYFSGVVVPPQQGYGQFGAQSQYTYSQYPQTVMNPMPYNPHGGVYAQQFGQHSPNPPRFSQDLGQYQNQPIVQPIAQNISQGILERPGRGPKPMVPPRGNSKITHDQGHRKSASVDVSSIQKYDPTNVQEVHRADNTVIVGTQVGPDGQERRPYLTPINQNPRTRQDGLYVELDGEQMTRDREAKIVQDSSISPECGLFVSRPDHRKSVSIDATASLQRRNDTITFTFPGDSQEILISGRKLSNAEMFPAEQRRVESSLRVSPMAFDSARQEHRMSVSAERKAEWGSASPNQRSVSQDSRRSDYYEEHRRSSPLTLENKRLDDVRRSPMPFVPIRPDVSVDRAGQKSPSFVNQAFEKTRQELVIWAEQRQRQELERGALQSQVFAGTSPRSRNPSEERRDPARLISQQDERKDARLTQSAFQPIPNVISQSTIMEQRRHLRHVSADLTKHVELSRKEFDEQPVTAGSVANLAPILGTVAVSSAHRASPSPCSLAHQYSAVSEAKLDCKNVLTVATDLDESAIAKPTEQVDHIIHSHRKNHNISSSLLTHSKSQGENLQGQLEATCAETIGTDSLQRQQQMQNQQSLDMISEKLSQFERQQSDLQAKLQCLQNQNQILDKVSQFQHQPGDLQVKLQAMQGQGTVPDRSSQSQRQQGESQHYQSVPEPRLVQTLLPDEYQDQAGEKSHQNQHQPQLQQSFHQAIHSALYQQSSEKLSPRLLYDHASDSAPGPIQISSTMQMPPSSSSQFDRNEVVRSSLQYRLSQADAFESIGVSSPVTFTGTLKKVPPEKPPRTSLIVQSPETESNRSQPAIGLKQTPKARPTIFGTVASDLNPKDGNSRRSLPQTPSSGATVKGLGGGGGEGGGGGVGPSPSMVNGASIDHQDIRKAVALNTEHALVYRDGNLVSGSLEALVQHMVPTEEYYPDRAYLFAFLLSARLFIKPHELLGEVCALCEHQQNLNGEGGKERLHRFVPRLVQLLAEWTETFPYDFRDERVMGHVRAITQKVAAVDAAARQEVSALLQNLLLRLTALERYEEGLARLATEAATEQLTQVDVTELCPSSTVLAQQLTHVELERLSYIGPEEFVQAFAKESPHLETSFKDMKKTRNLESYVQWFNRLSYFVATEVCKHAKKKQRVRVVEYWIETARECFNIGNFNSLMAIIAGLNMSPISRLKKTWSKVQSAKFSILEHQMDPSSNFSSYRSTLKAAMWRSAGATDERQRIVVPFFSLLVKDLYFLNEGCSNKLPNGHINFEKFWQLAKQVTEFIAWKQVACPFEKNPRVIAFLQASPVLTENALALASFECEPPDNNPEKERYKALKSELNAQ